MIKNKNILFVLIFYFCSSVYAQDCLGMKDNEEIRLDSPGGPLYKSRIQDQDGLPTCQFNSTSLALQTAIPKSPELSFLHIAYEAGETEKKSSNNFFLSEFNVCNLIQKLKDKKYGGVCARSDVELEKMLFNETTNSSKDSSWFQLKAVKALSDYLDSYRLNFAINSGMSKEEVSARILAYKKYKSSLIKMFDQRERNFKREKCLRPETENVEKVLKNCALRIYKYLDNKYEGKKIETGIDQEMNPDWLMANLYRSIGKLYTIENNQIDITFTNELKENLQKTYIADLNSSSPSPDAITALKKSLEALTDPKYKKKNDVIIEDLIDHLNAQDLKLLKLDYDKLANKKIDECLSKDDFDFFLSENGLINGFSNSSCLKNYKNLGNTIKDLAGVLNRTNFANVQSLYALLNKLPSVRDEEAMREILAPSCINKIKIPENLSCEQSIMAYGDMLQSKLYKTVDQKIEDEILKEKNIYIELIEKTYLMKKNELKKKHALQLATTSKTSRDNELLDLEFSRSESLRLAEIMSKYKVYKQRAGNDEPKYWNEFLDSNKIKFNSLATTLLKSEKQAIPIGICTTLFKDPKYSSNRDGPCALNSFINENSKDDALHSVTVIGSRCQKGKMNYLIQNSWGEWSPIKKLKNLDGSDHFESEFGKAWINEDELLPNMVSYAKITTKK